MADQQSINLLAFNFASRISAYRRLARRSSRSLSTFASVIREYLDPVIKGDQGAQYVDHIGTTDITQQQLTENLRAVFQSLTKASLRRSRAKRHFDSKKIPTIEHDYTKNFET